MFAGITKKPAVDCISYCWLNFYSIVNSSTRYLLTCQLVTRKLKTSYFFQSSVLNELIGSPSQNRSPSAQSLKA